MLSWGTANLADPAFFYYLNFENSLTQRFGTKMSYFWKTYFRLILLLSSILFGWTTDPKLPSLLKMLIWAQNQLDEKAAYPRINDLSTAKLEDPAV